MYQNAASELLDLTIVVSRLADVLLFLPYSQQLAVHEQVVVLHVLAIVVALDLLPTVIFSLTIEPSFCLSSPEACQRSSTSGTNWSD